MSLHVLLYRNRTVYQTFTVKQADGTNVTFESGDVFRVKIGRNNSALLDLSSAAASANGSEVDASNPSTVRFDGADIALLRAGVYDIEIAIDDASDEADTKHAEDGVCTILESGGG